MGKKLRPSPTFHVGNNGQLWKEVERFKKKLGYTVEVLGAEQKLESDKDISEN